jgi:hypothetical protein
MEVSEDALSLLRLLYEIDDDDTEAVVSTRYLSEQTGRDADDVQRILSPYLDLYVTSVSYDREPGEGSPLRFRYRLTDEGRTLFD